MVEEEWDEECFPGGDGFGGRCAGEVAAEGENEGQRNQQEEKEKEAEEKRKRCDEKTRRRRPKKW